MQKRSADVVKERILQERNAGRKERALPGRNAEAVRSVRCMSGVLSDRMPREENMNEYDVLVIGAGPAGLSAGGYSARAGRKTAILEEMSPGGQVMVIDEVENYPGLKSVSGYELSSFFEDSAVRFGAEIVYGSARSITKEGLFFVVQTESSEIKAKAIIVATGAKHRELGVQGELLLRGHGVSYCATCDGPFFKGKKILVCGGGDSAVQEAVYLTGITDKLTICHRRDRFRAQTGVVEKLKAKNGVSYKMNHTVLSINAGEDAKVKSVSFRDNATGREYTENFDAVFVFVGIIPNSDIAKITQTGNQNGLFSNGEAEKDVLECKKDESGFIETDFRMETSVPGVFAAGDVRATPFRQIVTAASDGAIAAHYASEYIETVFKDLGE